MSPSTTVWLLDVWKLFNNKKKNLTKVVLLVKFFFFWFLLWQGLIYKFTNVKKTSHKVPVQAKSELQWKGGEHIKRNHNT